MNIKAIKYWGISVILLLLLLINYNSNNNNIEKGCSIHITHNIIDKKEYIKYTKLPRIRFKSVFNARNKSGEYLDKIIDSIKTTVTLNENIFNLNSSYFCPQKLKIRKNNLISIKLDFSSVVDFNKIDGSHLIQEYYKTDTSIIIITYSSKDLIFNLFTIK